MEIQIHLFIHSLGRLFFSTHISGVPCTVLSTNFIEMSIRHAYSPLKNQLSVGVTGVFMILVQRSVYYGKTNERVHCKKVFGLRGDSVRLAGFEMVSRSVGSPQAKDGRATISLAPCMKDGFSAYFFRCLASLHERKINFYGILTITRFRVGLLHYSNQPIFTSVVLQCPVTFHNILILVLLAITSLRSSLNPSWTTTMAI